MIPILKILLHNVYKIINLRYPTYVYQFLNFPYNYKNRVLACFQTRPELGTRLTDLFDFVVRGRLDGGVEKWKTVIVRRWGGLLGAAGPPPPRGTDGVPLIRRGHFKGGWGGGCPEEWGGRRGGFVQTWVLISFQTTLERSFEDGPWHCHKLAYRLRYNKSPRITIKASEMMNIWA